MMKKLCVLVLGLFTLASVKVLANLTLECEPVEATFVKGIVTTQQVKINVTSDGEKVSGLYIIINLPNGLNVDENSISLSEDAIYAANVGVIQNAVRNSRVALNIQQNADAELNQKAILNLNSGQKKTLWTMKFAVDADIMEAADPASLTPTFSVRECKQCAGNNEYADLEYNNDNLVLNFTLLRDTYGFTTKPGKKIELNEDAAPVTIAATDENLFTAQVWDVEKAKLVATKAVEFRGATASEDAAGTVTVEGGKIIYTPAANYNGDFTINYTATFTGIAGANVEGAIDVTVNAVDDLPEIAIVTEDLSVDENAVLTFDMSFEDVDTAWKVFKKTVTLDDAEITGGWALKNDVLTRAVPVYTFTASNRVSYDTVKHPARKATLPLVVTLSVPDDDEPLDDEFVDTVAVATPTAYVTVNDVDRATDFGQTAITISADPNPAVYGSKLTADFAKAITDADGDEAEIAYQWYRGGAAVAGETALTLGAAVKKGEVWTIKATATVKPYGDEVADEREFPSGAITIGNTAPTTKDAALFIRKVDGGDGIGTVTITMADVDEDELAIVIKEQGTKGTAEVEGNTIKYTVTNKGEEFADDAADVVKFVVSDGDAESVEAMLTVTYRDNPPAEVAVTTPAPESIDEVNEAGEAVGFTVAISATDSNEVEPAGIQSIEWTAEDGLVVESVERNGLGTLTATSSAVIKTNGYATLDGAARLVNQEFTVTATVKDALGAVTTETFTVTVNDVDRKAPAAFTIAFDPAEPKTEDALTATVKGEAEDPDGDAIIGYKYVWTVNGEDVEADGNVLAAENYKKGDTVAVKACALTKPYGAEEVENDYMEEAATVEIANTVPALAKVKDAKLEAKEDQDATPYALADFVTVVDPDVTDGVDTLTYTVEVEPNFNEKVGTLVPDYENLTVTFKPAPDYNTDGLVSLPTFSVTVSDGGEPTEAVEIEIAVAAVNDKPTVTVTEDYVHYIQPEDIGEEVTVLLAVSPGPENESDQALEVERCEYNELVEGKVLIDGGEVDADIITDEEGSKFVRFRFTVAADAEIGAEGLVTFVVNDVIDDEKGLSSDEYFFKLTLSGTPWYPMVALPCEHDVDEDKNEIEGLMVRILTDDGKTTDVVVKKDKDEDKFVLTPAMYYNSGFKGFAPNRVGNITIYHWTAKSGTGKQCGGVIENGIIVPNYQKPGKAVIKGTETANVVTVSIALASKFRMEVYEALPTRGGMTRGTPIATVEQEFVPEMDNKQMETAATVTLANLEKGKRYIAVAKGYNPIGEEGEMSDEFPIDMTGKDAEVWPGDGEFFPPRNWNQTVATNTTKVTFKWPVDAKATSYTFKLYNGDGMAIATADSSVNSYQLSVEPGSYRWYVETSNGGKSDMMVFTITKVAGLAAVIKDGYGSRNVLTLYAENLMDGVTYRYDVIYFDYDYKQWAYQLFTGSKSGDDVLTLYGDDVEFCGSPNYIMVRPTGVGNYQTLLINGDMK